MNRLPPTRFPEDAGAGNESQSEIEGSLNPFANSQSHQRPPLHAGQLQGYVSQLSGSGSGQYPSYSNSSNADGAAYAADSPSELDRMATRPASGATAEGSDSTLFRDSTGGVIHPGMYSRGSGVQGGGITWAASPDVGRPTATHNLSYAVRQQDNNADNMKRKRSLVKKDQRPVDENSRFFNYQQHAAVYQSERKGAIEPSSTGYRHTPQVLGMEYGGGQGGISAVGLAPGLHGRPNMRRGKSILAREEGMANESGLNFLKRGATLRRKKTRETGDEELLKSERNAKKQQQQKQGKQKAPLGWWMIYCYIVTFFLPGFFLQRLGYTSLDRRRAFREKIGLLSVVACLMAAVGFLTFGFTSAVCDNAGSRYRAGSVQVGSMVFHGYDYAMDTFQHPAAPGIETNSNPLFSDWGAGGKDGSFMFQKVNQNCKGLITRAAGSQIPVNAQTGDLGWYFPCNIYDQFGSTPVNKTGYGQGQLCHSVYSAARTLFDEGRTRNVSNGFLWQGPVFYTWDDIRNSSRNLGVYKGSVLDFDLLRWLDRQQVNYPAVFDDLAAGSAATAHFRAKDNTMELLIGNNRTLAECMNDIIRVGFVDSKTMGCIVADIVLYISLVFILAVVGIKFLLAVIFSWFFGRRMGAFKKETNADRMKKIAEVEAWSKDIYRPAPAKYRPSVKNARKSCLPTTSRFTQQASKPYSAYNDQKRQSTFGFGKLSNQKGQSPPDTPVKTSKSSTSLPLTNQGRETHSRASSFDMLDSFGKPLPFPLDVNVVPQPPPGFQPHHFPLAHTILLVTAYSESVEGLRTTMDSLATTDYPNSHKLILVICDGMVKGSGNTLSTPDIVLTMMKDTLVPKEEVEPLSYVAVADGHKRHNMAKVYAGYYDYDDQTVELSKQQRVPMILIAKCGNPLEAHDAKPGNRGKRDSQVLLMAFLQKVLFDERMSNFEYELFNSVWKITGVSVDHYEHILMVDADTKVFPDSVTRMVACMVQDTDIMGLCGETKIANKKETWVTMIQVFEYYISHHQTKAFESMWGGVTCLPGCFSMYRIKAPKGSDGYWVPILANPDIVEHYSENVVDTLHKKNLLLLGEDRYLTTLMLKTFPKRKMMFCPQAYCKTVVPDTFRVLLSQRRRWINSTIHNLFELLLVRDLCGTFCFSMQFVVFMELVGTLVLPAAISFTIYILVLTCLPNREKPVIPLILLACILGLPGILIIVTSRKIAYVGWMAIYLLSLPIWNAVLPAYAYFHMDDFSWGSTRKIEGESKAGGHGDKEGEFDSNAISMKRWAEWERERRWKSGTRSRDSAWDHGSSGSNGSTSGAPIYGNNQQRGGSPYRSSTNRNSLISTTDTFVSQSTAHNPQDPFYRASSMTMYGTNSSPGLSGKRAESVQVLELPAPLSAQPQQQPYQHVPSSAMEVYDNANLHNYEISPYHSSSSENFHQASSQPRPDDEYPRYRGQEGYDSDSAEREAMMPRTPRSPMTYDASPSVLTESTLTARTPSPMSPASGAQLRSPLPPSSSRGVSLYDPGPVTAPNGAVRVVQRNRRVSQQTRPARQSISEAPAAGDPLPEGAAPRRP